MSCEYKYSYAHSAVRALLMLIMPVAVCSQFTAEEDVFIADHSLPACQVSGVWRGRHIDFAQITDECTDARKGCSQRPVLAGSFSPLLE